MSHDTRVRSAPDDAPFEPLPVSESMACEGLVSMLTAGLETERQRRSWPEAAALLAAGWIGFIGISGAHLGGAWGAPWLGIAPRPVLFGAALGLLLLAAGLAARCGRRATFGLAAMLAAYLVGNLLSGAAHLTLGAEPILAGAPVWLGFIGSRLLYAAAVALPMLVVHRFAYRGAQRIPEAFHFGAGSWRGHTRLGKKDRPRSWATLLAGFAVVGAVPFFLLMQWQVGFAPLLGGRLPALLLPIVGMALANAFAEELLFRGFLQGAAIGVLGPARGIWAVGLLFGLHHLGASFDPLASLPGALLVGAGSVLFAKSVLETRGLAWAVCAHAMVNVGTFTAFYVAV